MTYGVQVRRMLAPRDDQLPALFTAFYRIIGIEVSGNFAGALPQLRFTQCYFSDGKRLDKPTTAHDLEIIERAVEESKVVLERMGVARENMFLGTINAGHPGGCLPLTKDEASTLHHGHLPANLYVADSTLLPHSMGNPPILTIMALATRVAKVCCDSVLQ